MKPLYDSVKKYADLKPLVFHVPGHKFGRAFRREVSQYGVEGFFDAPRFDITELPGTDNLHYPDDSIMEAQKLAAKTFRSSRTWFLVNGATCGIHTMIMAVCPPGSKLIILRDFHMSAFNGMMLAGVAPCYVHPGHTDMSPVAGTSRDENLVISRASDFAHPNMTRRMILDAIAKNTDASAVYITRPNYYGDMCELEEIVNAAHKHGMWVIVDEAHGAHLPFSKKLPLCAMDAGADICVQSAHKTLAAFTQGAYLHASSRAASDEGIVYRIETALRCLQTSSPSYVVMSSLDFARELMQENGERELDERLLPLCEDFFHCMKEIGYGTPTNAAAITVEGEKKYLRDMTKLVLNTNKIGLSGIMTEAMLFEKFNVRIEMSDISGIVMVTTIADTAADFERLKSALTSIASTSRDKSLPNLSHSASDTSDSDPNLSHTASDTSDSEPNLSHTASDTSDSDPNLSHTASDTSDFAPDDTNYSHPDTSYSTLGFNYHLHREVTQVDLPRATGMIAAAMVTPYPPGVPLICPGEVYTPELTNIIGEMLRSGIKVTGVRNDNSVIVYRASNSKNQNKSNTTTITQARRFRYADSF